MSEFSTAEMDSPSVSLFAAVTTDPIQHLNPKIPLTVGPDVPIAEAVQIMQEKRIGALLVEADKKLIGIVTERDMLFKVLGKGVDIHTTPVKDVMTPHPESLTADDQILYALNRMTIGGYRHIPLTDLEGHLTGIISVKDIVEYLVSIVERAVLDSSQFE